MTIEPLNLRNLIIQYNSKNDNKGLRNYGPDLWNLQFLLDELHPNQIVNFKNHLMRANADLIQTSLFKAKCFIKNKVYDILFNKFNVMFCIL